MEKCAVDVVITASIVWQKSHLLKAIIAIFMIQK